MMQMQNTYTPTPARTMPGRQTADWSGEISTGSPQTQPAPDTAMGGMTGTGMMVPGSRGLMMQNNMPAEVIQSPTSLNEAFLGSLKSTLIRNKGNFIVATFLIGTQNTVSWEGILYEVGNDYVTIYQEGRDRYIVCDMYSLKYMEFYDTRRQELCAQLLRERGWQE